MVLVPAQELGIVHTQRTEFDLNQRDTLLKLVDPDRSVLSKTGRELNHFELFYFYLR